MENNKISKDEARTASDNKQKLSKDFLRMTEDFESAESGFGSLAKDSPGGILLDKPLLTPDMISLDGKNEGADRKTSRNVHAKRLIPSPKKVSMPLSDEGSVMSDGIKSHTLAIGKWSGGRNYFFPLIGVDSYSLNLSGYNPYHLFEQPAASMKFSESTGKLEKITSSEAKFKILSGLKLKLVKQTVSDLLPEVSNYSFLKAFGEASHKVTFSDFDDKIMNSKANVAYRHDPASDEYNWEVVRAREKLVTFYGLSPNRANLLTYYSSVFQGVLHSIVELGTFLHIMYTATISAFKNIATIGNKTGVIDSTIKRILNAARTHKDSVLAGLNRLSTLVNFLPYNELVVEAFKKFSNPRVPADLHEYDADTMMNVSTMILTSAHVSDELQ